MSHSRLLGLRAEGSRVLEHVKPPRCGEGSRKPLALTRVRTQPIGVVAHGVTHWATRKPESACFSVYGAHSDRILKCEVTKQRFARVCCDCVYPRLIAGQRSRFSSLKYASPSGFCKIAVLLLILLWLLRIWQVHFAEGKIYWLPRLVMILKHLAIQGWYLFPTICNTEQVVVLVELISANIPNQMF